MTVPTPGSVVALAAHARRVNADARESLATRLREALSDRALLLVTCHRVEAYTVAGPGGDPFASASSLPRGAELLVGEPAVRHAVAVAVGRDSVVVGEDQVLHQLRRSVDSARATGALDPTIERLFSVALGAGRRARSWRQGPERSLADVAIASIAERRGAIRGARLLVVGAGRMGRLAAEAAVRAGASVSIASRSPGSAAELAAVVGGRALPFDPGPSLTEFVAVIVALAGPWPIAARSSDALATSRAVVVDLSVPAAVPAGLGDRLDGRFVTADDLAQRPPEPAPAGRWTARLDALIDRTAAEFMAWDNGRGGRATAEALMDRADRERAAELAALWRRLPDLEPDARAAIERMTRHLAGRLLREPLRRLGRDGDGCEARAVRDIFAL